MIFSRCMQIGVVIGLTVVAACGGGGSSAPVTSAAASPTTTAKGVIDNTEVGSGKTIGPAGDTLSTVDNKLTLTIPPGALASDTTINIVRITNTAHGGIAGGYRLEPDGQVFNTPVTLTFKYTDDQLDFNDPEVLGAAFQTAAGYWQWLSDPVVDLATQTVSVSTTHFSDYSMVKGFQIQPAEKTIRVNESAALNVVYCYHPALGDNELQPLGFDCDSSDDELAPLIPTADVTDWSVNGVIGGNSSAGTVNGSGAAATYHAPDQVPSSNPVAVSAQVSFGSTLVTVVANITVVDSINYTGSLLFSADIAGGITVTHALADVTWTQFEDLGDVRSYVPTGSITVDSVSISGCDPLSNVSIPLMATVAHGPGPTLVVYTSSNSTYPNSYQFALTADDTQLTFNCNGYPYTAAASSLINIMVGACTLENLPFTDETHLSGTYNKQCINMTAVDALWDFKMP